MGVFKHRDGTQETVAVKKLKNTARSTPETHDLQRECAIMKVIFFIATIFFPIHFHHYIYIYRGLRWQSLSHPNIVSLKAIMMETSTMLVMEYIPMGCLLAYVRSIQNNQRITDQQMIHFASDIAEVQKQLHWNQYSLIFFQYS